MPEIHAEVRFDGEMLSLEQFYEPLGVKVTELGLRFENFQLIYFGEGLGVDELTLSISIDGDLNEVETHYQNIGVAVLDEGFDSSGPYIVVRDPAGLRVCIRLTSAALLRNLKRNSE